MEQDFKFLPITKEIFNTWKGYYPEGLLFRDTNNNVHIVGKVNINGGYCDCCSDRYFEEFIDNYTEYSLDLINLLDYLNLIKQK